MCRKPVSAIALMMVLIGLLCVGLRAQRIEAAGTIYIKADGSVDPPTTPILSYDKITYYFVDDIYGNIIVLKENLVLNGQGFILHGTGNPPPYPHWGTGIDLTGISNITIKNMEIKRFNTGIYLNSSSTNTISGNTITTNRNGIRFVGSSYNTISRNNITDNEYYGIKFLGSSSNSISENNITDNWRGEGIVLWDSSNHNSISGNNVGSNGYSAIWLDSSLNNSVYGNNITANIFRGIVLDKSNRNDISGNNITNNNWDGILLSQSSDNSVSGNNLRGNGYGMWLSSSSSNSIYGNDIVANIEYGIRLNASSNNFIYHNSFVDNARQIYDMSWDVPWYPPSINTWDDGAGKGNYWSDYEYRYPDAEELDGTGLWDTPYVIDENNQDNYSIVPEFSSFLILPIFIVATLLAVILCRRKHPM